MPRKLSKPKKKPASADPRTGPLKRLSPSQRRQQILTVVRELFTQRPYPEISVADVAQAAGITQGLVYHYFDSRIGLLSAAMKASTAELLQACIPNTSLPVLEQFQQGVIGYLDYVQSNRVAYWNVFRGPASLEPEFQVIVDETRDAIVEHVIDILGLADVPVAATRLSLRGYLGYAEAAILHWIEKPSVERPALERMLVTVIMTALSTGLSQETAQPLSGEQIADFERAYRCHFGF